MEGSAKRNNENTLISRKGAYVYVRRTTSTTKDSQHVKMQISNPAAITLVRTKILCGGSIGDELKLENQNTIHLEE